MRNEAVGIGNDPLAFGIGARGGVHGGNRNVEAMRGEAGLASEGAKVKAITASGVEHDVLGTRLQNVRDGAREGLSDSAVVQSASRSYCARGVARLLRAAVLWLEQIDVAALGDVEGMGAGTEQPTLFARQREPAIADGAEQHPLLKFEARADTHLPFAEG